MVLFLVFDLAFFGANLLKFKDGGWFPIAVAAAIFTLMTTWKRGPHRPGRALPPDASCRWTSCSRTSR